MKKFNGRKTARNSGNAYAVSVVIALLLASVLLATYYVALRPQSEGYMTIYLLDSQKKGVDYPNSLVANVNSTFSVYVYVENHMGRMINGTQVLVKVTSDSNPTFPLTVNATQTLTGAVKDGETGETAATVTLNQPGNYLVAFELWVPNGETAQFSGEYCCLNVQVTA